MQLFLCQGEGADTRRLTQYFLPFFFLTIKVFAKATAIFVSMAVP